MAKLSYNVISIGGPVGTWQTNTMQHPLQGAIQLNRLTPQLYPTPPHFVKVPSGTSVRT